MHQETEKFSEKFFSFIFLCFKLRGNAGSHDLPFSIETLTAVCKLTKEGVSLLQSCSFALYACLTLI